MPVISEKAIDQLDLSAHGAMFTGYSDVLKNLIGLMNTGNAIRTLF